MLNSQAVKLLTMLAGAPPLETTLISVRRDAATNAVSLTGELTELPSVEDTLLDTTGGQVPVRDAGVPTALRRFEGQPHAFVSLAGVIDDGSLGEIGAVVRLDI